MNDRRKAYLIGGGIGCLAAAAFMIRDGGMRGADILIFEAGASMGGSLDANRLSDGAYAMRGSRMMTADNFECTWDLFRSIPSLSGPSVSVYDETLEFSERVKWDAKARLVDRNRAIVDVASMGFSIRDRAELLRLSEASEEALETTRITDWLSPGFFETPFWWMWSTTFAFQPWHSALEFKRYMRRFIKSFSRIDKMSGVKHPVYNHYDSMIRPLVAWLRSQGVRFETNCRVTDFELAMTDGKVTVASLQFDRSGEASALAVDPDNLVFFQNASMTDASTWGSMTSPPEKRTKAQSGGWALWEKLADRFPEFGAPRAFSSSIPETNWISFTVTLRDPRFFDAMEAFTGNEAGTGGLVTFKDSAWLISILLYRQPHFLDQPANVQVFWGYALHPDRIGDFVAKPMADCGGREILRELCGHLNFDPEIVASATCLPCRMPYITSQFMPRRIADRPLPVPKTSRNLAFVSQFVEAPDDTVFTIEYSVRAAQIAVYTLLDVTREVPPVSPHDKSLRVQIDALIKAFR